MISRRRDAVRARSAFESAACSSTSDPLLLRANTVRRVPALVGRAGGGCEPALPGERADGGRLSAMAGRATLDMVAGEPQGGLWRGAAALTWARARWRVFDSRRRSCAHTEGHPNKNKWKV